MIQRYLRDVDQEFGLNDDIIEAMEELANQDAGR